MTIRRPRMSCEGTVSQWLPPTSLSRGSLLMSRTSATMNPCRPYGIVRSTRMQRRVSASALFGSLSSARIMTDLARWAPTLMRSCVSSGEPLRKTTLEPRRCFFGSRIFSSASMSCLPCLAITTMTPPPSLWFATHSSSMRRMDFSVHPRMREWFFSTTRALPCLKRSILLRMTSTTTPSRAAKKIMPMTAIRLATARWLGSTTEACVPGSAMKVHETHRPSRKAP
mmetsp:Transcript_81384/g.251210  ORF Transcript_81384/g.251210 Transcript_81384/m.251210 type:complete len:226 (-) Transcript_81384:432-1109(-)